MLNDEIYNDVREQTDGSTAVASELLATTQKRRCSPSEFTHLNNRDGEELECLKCEYENHADYNAAKNIDLWYLCRNQTEDSRGATLATRLNSGTVNGGYSPAVATGQNGSLH